jgi:hypothetical protein
MDIIISARRHPKKFNVPHNCQHEPEDNDAPRKSGRCEKLTDPEQVRYAGHRHSGHEVRSTPIAEIA